MINLYYSILSTWLHLFFYLTNLFFFFLLIPVLINLCTEYLLMSECILNFYFVFHMSLSVKHQKMLSVIFMTIQSRSSVNEKLLQTINDSTNQKWVLEKKKQLFNTWNLKLFHWSFHSFQVKYFHHLGSPCLIISVSTNETWRL